MKNLKKLYRLDGVLCTLFAAVGACWALLRHDSVLVLFGMTTSFALGGLGASTLLLEFRNEDHHV
jgi:hypothetical protein